MKNLFDKVAYLGSIIVGGWVLGVSAVAAILILQGLILDKMRGRQPSMSDQLDKEIERFLDESSRPQ